MLFLTLCNKKAIYNYTNKFVADTIIYFFYTKVLLNMKCDLKKWLLSTFTSSGKKICQPSKNLKVTI